MAIRVTASPPVDRAGTGSGSVRAEQSRNGWKVGSGALHPPAYPAQAKARGQVLASLTLSWIRVRQIEQPGSVQRDPAGSMFHCIDLCAFRIQWSTKGCWRHSVICKPTPRRKTGCKAGCKLRVCGCSLRTAAHNPQNGTGLSNRPVRGYMEM